MSETAPESHRTTRPALDVLKADQQALLYDGDQRRTPAYPAIVDGMTSYWKALIWYQAATVRTLGRVGHVIKPSDMHPESGILGVLLLPDEDEADAFARQRLVESLDDACDRAYRAFRERAQERVDSTDGRTFRDIDPSDEGNPMMRPAFKRLDEGQATLLTSLWDGFDSRREVSRWVNSMGGVTNGEKPEGLMSGIAGSPPLLEALMGDTRADTLTRYRFACGCVLPAFLRAAQTLHGGEHSNVNRTTHSNHQV